MTQKTDATPTVAVLTLGCKLNQADSEALARRLVGEGLRVVDRPVRGAAAVVINTCSVTHVADRKARHLVRLARRLSPEAEIILTGCYAETAPADIGQVIGADAVFTNAEKPQIADRLLSRLEGRGDPYAGCPTPVRNPLRTRAFIKIQEGCDELCSFCIVPYTRGRERSVPIADIVRQVQEREADGVLEVVLTGTQLGNYGRDLGWPRAEQGPRRLLAELLGNTSIPRLRMSSLQAQDIGPDLLALWSDARLCRHFHLPLQSGSDAVLGPMRRRYTADQYRQALSLIREHVPGAAITTDVIAGFPGETDADFEATLRLCEDAGFADMHCFPYSRRPHTGADRMDGHLPTQTRRERLERLLTVQKHSSEAHRRGRLGDTADVLWEERTDGRWRGLTGDYVRVYAASDSDLTNRITATHLQRLEGEGMYGVPALP
ncbi:MAG: tRNA (N(6)-L-threonylcarbamoyladenosine(37)-C(2))-methylthiotransferase MtaB [Chloroflexi bacterium]|nr:tRNA (N(6)-L-threonylcarbamoyladenosine(37)-C(2))-methylthiotransferase MtaB [Chloroflexota bacterium]MCI0832274.1 tRNA (N(6)-L-threonylcarbamoyladenosine(37)-C(2))-methylthiotransferase MtaB [Chloroflexota bacterium]MCI0883059.1 tRNA (N(6)-L-threonylcarbamoyladenosine(37)-C(2))-methylthiotransferase MtaB [Chloroflexota bacterium]